MAEKFIAKVRCKQRKSPYDGKVYGEKEEFCQRELLVDEEDLVRWTNFYKTEYGVICPYCGKFVLIDKDQIPMETRKNATSVSLYNIYLGNDGYYRYLYYKTEWNRIVQKSKRTAIIEER